MYYWIEDRDDCTVYYEIQTVKWSLCCAYFYLSEAFEISGIPTVYRNFFAKGKKPTFKEWLGRHPRWWSKATQYPKGTRIVRHDFPELTLGWLNRTRWNMFSNNHRRR